MLPNIGKAVSKTHHQWQQPKHYSAVIGQAKNRFCFIVTKELLGVG